jgi:acyl carrier protein
LPKSFGRGLVGSPLNLIVQQLKVETGSVSLRVAGELGRQWPLNTGMLFTISIGREDDLSLGVHPCVVRRSGRKMADFISNEHFNKDAILSDLLKILEDMASEWEVEFAGAIGPETRLEADLSFQSIQVVQLIIAIEEHFQRQELPFQTLLMPDGRPVRDLRVVDVADFLYTQVNKS